MPVTIRGRTAKGSQTFLLFLIKPSHYDDDGYVIQWARNDIPSNTHAQTGQALPILPHDHGPEAEP